MADRPLPGSLLFHLGFWSVVFLLNVGPDWHRYSSIREVAEVVGTTTVLQGLVALIALKVLVPRWLDQGQAVRFGILLAVVLLLAAQLNVLISYAYLEPAYPETYGKSYQAISELSLLERLGFSSMIRYIAFSKLPLFFFPAAVLVAVRYYRRQQSVSELREQKRAAELDALKNQLNPHFIFNTLNNIYALAIKNSSLTAEAVAKLAGILDYVLYRCSGTDVSLQDEVEMIENYIDLERLRFGERMGVTFTHEIAENVRIAPLLVLTLIENAFKHGAREELRQADVELSLTAGGGQVVFEISNSKPPQAAAGKRAKPGIGLDNLRRQLNLLYPDAHQLDVTQTDRRYTVRLQIAGISP